jgi:hypothetical protein
MGFTGYGLSDYQESYHFSSSHTGRTGQASKCPGIRPDHGDHAVDHAEQRSGRGSATWKPGTNNCAVKHVEDIEHRSGRGSATWKPGGSAYKFQRHPKIKRNSIDRPTYHHTVSDSAVAQTETVRAENTSSHDLRRSSTAPSDETSTEPLRAAAGSGAEGVAEAVYAIFEERRASMLDKVRTAGFPAEIRRSIG